jgi:hypothetical protein
MFRPDFVDFWQYSAEAPAWRQPTWWFLLVEEHKGTSYARVGF